MALYATAVTTFALASQVSHLASSELLDIMKLTPWEEGGDICYNMSFNVVICSKYSRVTGFSSVENEKPVHD
jgi:hypothetical protein